MNTETITSRTLGTDGHYGDAGQATAAMLELLELEKALGTQPGTVTLCTVMFRLPGKAAVQFTWEATYREMQKWLIEQIGDAMARYGLTEDDLWSASSPIKVAVGRQMPAGNFVTRGNWPSAMRGLPTAMSVHALADREGNTGEIEILEMLFRR